MESKKSITVFLLIFIIIVSIIAGIFIYNKNTNKSENSSQESSESSSVSYVVLQVEDKSAQELEYKSKQITDKQKINDLIKIIDSATSYKENNFSADFGDIPPCAKIYLTNGENYTVAAGDEINNNGKAVNLMSKWTSEDGSDKSLYQVNTKLGEYIEKLFNE